MKYVHLLLNVLQIEEPAILDRRLGRRRAEKLLEGIGTEQEWLLD